MPEPMPTCPFCNNTPTGTNGILYFCEWEGCPNEGHQFTEECWRMRHGVAAAVEKTVAAELVNACTRVRMKRERLGLLSIAESTIVAAIRAGDDTQPTKESHNG